MPPIPTAILGFGLSGRQLQAPFFTAHPGFQLRRVMTSRKEALQEAYPEVIQARTVEEVLTDETIELVSIATPNSTHYELARAVLEAGKHVLVDKPACATAAELRDLRDLATSRGRHIFVFQNRRWDSDFLTLQQVLRSGKLGRLVAYEARYDRWKPAPNAKAWKETPGPGAGMLFDLGAHLIDQTIACFGIPKHTSGRAWKQRAFSTIPDAFNLHFEYDDFVADLSCSLLVAAPTPRYRLHGDRGAYVKYGIDVQEDHLVAGLRPGEPGFGWEPTSQAGVLYTQTEEGELTKENYPTLQGQWMRLFDQLHATIRQDAPLAVPIEDVIAQLEIIEDVLG
jgi:predicted dehydrogenase